MYEMRALLQAEAIRRIPLPADRALIDRLEAIHDQYCEAVDRHDLKRVCTLNNEFHHTMFSACNNGYLAGMIQRAWVETLGIRCYAIGDPVLLVRSRTEHRKMLDALKAGERNKLVQLCVDHLACIASLQASARRLAHGSRRRCLTRPRQLHSLRSRAFARGAYDANYLIDNKAGIILDAKRTGANRIAEIAVTQTTWSGSAAVSIFSTRGLPATLFMPRSGNCR